MVRQLTKANNFSVQASNLDLDFAKIEQRVLSEEKDIHKETAAIIYGIKEEDVTDKMRRVGKVINFGVIYGVKE